MKKRNPIINTKTLFILLVLLPTILSIVYYVAICTKRYVSESTISIRSPESNSTDLLQSLTGLPSSSGSGSVLSDSFAIEKLIFSQDMLNKLPDEISLSNLYSKPEIDTLSRLKSNFKEDRLDYWKSRVSLSIDPMSNLAVLKTEAYTPDEAIAINEFLIQSSEEYVNELSTRLKGDATTKSIEEAEIAKERLRKVSLEMSKFLEDSGKITFEESIASQASLISGLEAELAQKQTELSAKTAYLRPDSNSLIVLKGEIQALQSQIRKQQSSLERGSSSKRTTEELAAYNKLLLEKKFAEEAYAAAQATLEKTRIDASTQQRYLIRITEPTLADEATEPNVLVSILTIFFIAFFIWAILSLAIATIKEHIGWVH